METDFGVRGNLTLALRLSSCLNPGASAFWIPFFLMGQIIPFLSTLLLGSSNEMMHSYKVLTSVILVIFLNSKTYLVVNNR